MKKKVSGLFSSIFNLRVRLWAVLLLCAMCVGGTAGVSIFTERQKVGGEENYVQAMKYLEIVRILDDYYVGETDEAAVTGAAFGAMVKALGDKWSYYMTPDEYKAYQLYSANQYAGIGVTIQVDGTTGGFMIMTVTENAPAAKAGLVGGEIIMEVDGEDVTGLTLSEMRTLIQSHLDDSLELTIRDSEGKSQKVKLDCTIIYTDPVTYELLDMNVGYIKISNFESGAGANSVAAVDDLLAQGAVALVFDVRSNPGGLLSELITILDYLLPAGDLFVSVDESGQETVTKSNNLCIDMPMAVIVNGDSYSAAEFFAAALKEYQWARIVGERTTGKARSQITIELEDGSAVHISNNTYLTPLRVDLSAEGGLIPDVPVEMGEKGDAQLDAAITEVFAQIASVG